MNVYDGMKTKAAAALLPLIMVAGLAACGGGGGGGGGGGSGSGNESPVVDAGDAQTVLAGSTVELEATATDDGSIAAWSWAQTDDNASVTLSASDDSAAEFEAPSVTEETVLAFELTVTDDEGKTAKDTVEITVLPAVGLSAKVYDGPLAGAKVTVTIGDQVYSATADEDGAFTLLIGSPDPDAMIFIQATGGAEQEFAELVSIAGTFGALAAAAGDDGMVDASESGAVNVTNLSTAKAVLMIAANGNEMPADDAAIGELEKSIDSDAVLELATVIKLVIDADIPLPEGVESTLDLIEDDAAIDTVMETAAAKDPDLFQETMNAILDDPNLSSGFTTADIPGIYFVNRAGDYVVANRGFSAELEEDGTGFIYGASPEVSANVAWTVDSEGELQVDIADDDPLVTTGTCSTAIGHVTCNVTTTALTFRRIVKGAIADTVSMARTGTVHYPGNEEDLPDQPLSGSALYLAMEPNALEPFTTSNVKGTWSVPLSFPNPDPVGDRYETDLLTFNADGTGNRPADSMTFTWQIDAEGILHIAFANDDTLDIYWLRKEGELGMDAMVIMTTATGDIYTLPHLIVSGVDSDFAGSLYPDGLDGYWHYMDWLGFDYELDSVAGTATQLFYDSEDDATPEQYTNGFTFDGIVAKAITYIDATTEQWNGPLVSSCSGVDKCYYAYSSSWYPLAKDSSGRIFMLEKDEGWYYDDANTVNYQGDKNYRHGVNRWLGPTSSGVDGMAKRSTDVSNRGERVRALLGAPVFEGQR